MFRSRRSVAPLPETAKVAQVVQAYYDAGKRPASHLTPAPAQIAVEVPDEAPAVAAEPVLAPEPAPVATLEADTVETNTVETNPEETRSVDAAPASLAQQSAPVHQTLAELAEELEAFIEVIRYGDDLGGRTART